MMCFEVIFLCSQASKAQVALRLVSNFSMSVCSLVTELDLRRLLAAVQGTGMAQGCSATALQKSNGLGHAIRPP